MTAAAAEIHDREVMRAAALRRACGDARKYFHRFTELVVQNANADPIRYAPLHYSWIAHVNYCWARGLHAGIFSHFGSGKSSSLVCPLVAWLVGRDPTERIKVICAGDQQAVERVGLAKMIMESPAYRAVFPNVVRGNKWSDHMLYAERSGQAIDPTVEARGVFSKGTGGRATRLFFDDTCDLQNSSEEGTRDRVKTYVRSLWLSRLEANQGAAGSVQKKGLALWVATPWTMDDASAYVRSRHDFAFLEQRVNADLTAYEQHVSNVGPDYEEETAADMEFMMAPAQ